MESEEVRIQWKASLMPCLISDTCHCLWQIPKVKANIVTMCFSYFFLFKRSILLFMMYTSACEYFDYVPLDIHPSFYIEKIWELHQKNQIYLQVFMYFYHKDSRNYWWTRIYQHFFNDFLLAQTRFNYGPSFGGSFKIGLSLGYRLGPKC